MPSAVIPEWRRGVPPLVLTLSLTISMPGLAGVQTTAGSIAGQWVLNDDLSDDQRASAPQRRSNGNGQGRGPAVGGFGGPGGGFGGRRGGFGGSRGGFGGPVEDRPDREDTAEMRRATQEALDDLMTAPRRMTIVESAREVMLTYGDGRVVRLIPDNREHAGVAGTSMKVTRRTNWESGILVARIELQSRVDLRLDQTYEVDLEGQRLIVTSTFEGERFEDDDSREFRRVYDRDLR